LYKCSPGMKTNLSMGGTKGGGKMFFVWGTAKWKRGVSTFPVWGTKKKGEGGVDTRIFDWEEGAQPPNNGS